MKRMKALVWNQMKGNRMLFLQFGNVKSIVVLISLVCLQVVSFAQEVKIHASIDSSTILIGDAIKLQLSATYNPLEYRVQFPIVQDTFNHFEVTERSKIDTVATRDESTFKQTITITNFDSGQWKIPAMNFDVQSLKGAEPSSMSTDSFLVNVNTITVDTAQPFKPIKGIRGASMPLAKLIFYIVVAIIALALLAFLIWYLIKRYREKNDRLAVKEPEIILAPHENALHKLAKLEAEKLWQQNEEKRYHTELTDIIRNYLEQQFSIDCFEKTSSEIIQQIKKIKALSTSRQILRTIFETADMVKFAKSKPTPEEHLQSMEFAKEFIHESYKRVKPIEIENKSTTTL